AAKGNAVALVHANNDWHGRTVGNDKSGTGCDGATKPVTRDDSNQRLRAARQFTQTDSEGGVGSADLQRNPRVAVIGRVLNGEIQRITIGIACGPVAFEGLGDSVDVR